MNATATDYGSLVGVEPAKAFRSENSSAVTWPAVDQEYRTVGVVQCDVGHRADAPFTGEPAIRVRHEQLNGSRVADQIVAEPSVHGDRLNLNIRIAPLPQRQIRRHVGSYPSVRLLEDVFAEFAGESRRPAGDRSQWRTAQLRLLHRRAHQGDVAGRVVGLLDDPASGLTGRVLTLTHDGHRTQRGAGERRGRRPQVSVLESFQPDRA